jgi:hypothetical protein
MTTFPLSDDAVSHRLVYNTNMFVGEARIARFDFDDREPQLPGAMFQFVNNARLLNHAGRLVAGE